jgi:hypothetical protein
MATNALHTCRVFVSRVQIPKPTHCQSSAALTAVRSRKVKAGISPGPSYLRSMSGYENPQRIRSVMRAF